MSDRVIYDPKLIPSKCQTLAEEEGFDSIEELMLQYSTDSVCPSICMNPGCDYTAEMEPDQDRGWCENCATNTVASPMILMGII